ncbi:MAG: hypothetical protein Q7U75_08570 [Desulfobacterales bacterium]|nr:hypothetical protein [Desulfobacterales bacterium]
MAPVVGFPGKEKFSADMPPYLLCLGPRLPAPDNKPFKLLALICSEHKGRDFNGCSAVVISYQQKTAIVVRVQSFAFKTRLANPALEVILNWVPIKAVRYQVLGFKLNEREFEVFSLGGVDAMGDVDFNRRYWAVNPHQGYIHDPAIWEAKFFGGTDYFARKPLNSDMATIMRTMDVRRNTISGAPGVDPAANNAFPDLV